MSTTTARHRERFSGDTITAAHAWCTLGCTWDHYDNEYVTHYQNEVCDDYVTSNFRKEIKAGRVINNPVSYTLSSRTPSGSGMYTSTKKVGEEIYHVSGPLTHWVIDKRSGPLAWGTPQSSKDCVARSKQLALANIDTTPYAFGEDLLELKETVRFLKRPLGALFDLSEVLDRAARRYHAQFPTLRYAQAVSAVWLQYRFAAAPLIRSSMDAVEAYSDKAPTPPTRRNSRGFCMDTWYDNQVKYKKGDWTFSKLHKAEWDVHSTIMYEVSNPIYDWRYKLGFRNKDHPTTLWQIVPLSFMVDRLFDISSMLKGAINLMDPNIAIQAASTRVKYTREKEYGVTKRDESSWATYEVSGDKVKEKEFSYDRYVWYPIIADTVPRLTLPNLVDDATKLFDLVGIMISTFKGR